MKIWALVLPLVLGLSACADGSRSSGTGGLIRVNDRDFSGSRGDQTLSLAEAIDLATGRLKLEALSASERDQVSGSPGAGRSDTIRLEPGATIAIRRIDHPVASILPQLDDPGDALDGQGAVLDGSSMGDQPQPGLTEVVVATDTAYQTAAVAGLLLVAASRVSITGLTIANVPAGAITVVGGAGGMLEGVKIAGNTIRGLGRNSFSGGIFAVAGFNTDGGSLTDLSIVDNQVVDTPAGVVLFAGGSVGTGHAARGNRAERIEIRGNQVERPLTGIIVYAANASLGAEASDNLLREVQVIDNRIDENLDVGILSSTTQPLDSGPTARNVIEALLVRGNAITSPPGFGRINTGIFLSGGQAFYAGTSADDRCQGVVVEQNVVDGHFTGATIFGGDAERCGDGCATTGSSFTGLRLSDNVWRNVANGLVLVGGIGVEAAATVRGNLLGDVLLERETILARDSGLTLIGSQASSLPLGMPCLACTIEFPGYRLPGTLSANRIQDVTVRDSTIEANDAVVISGGTMVDTEDTIDDSSVRGVHLENNRIAGGRSGIIVIGGIVLTAGSVRDSSVEAISCTGNQDASGMTVVAVSVPQVATEGAPADRVSGNTVSQIACP